MFLVELKIKRAKLLKTISGIGLISAMFILTEVEDINRFPNAERFASFIGLILMSHSSGDKEKVGKITFRSHYYLRSTFIESAWMAIRHDPVLLASYQNQARAEQCHCQNSQKTRKQDYSVLKYNKSYELGKTNNR